MLLDNVYRPSLWDFDAS